MLTFRFAAVGAMTLALLAGCRSDTVQSRKNIAALIQSHAEELRKDPSSVAAWDTYRQHLYSDWHFERVYATGTMSEMGPAEPQAVEELIKLLTCGDRGVEQEAMNALEDIGPNARRAVPALIEIAQRSDVTMQGFAINAIGRIAEPTPDVVAVVEAASESESERVRSIANVALRSLKKRDIESEETEGQPAAMSTRTKIES